MRWPFGPPHLTFKPSKKQTQIQNKKQKAKTKKEGLRAKWGGPSGHLTWPLNPQTKTKTKRTKTKKKKKQEKKAKITRQTKKYPKISFSAISQDFLCWGGVQKFPFLTTWPRSAHPQSTIKIGVSAHQFLKTVMRHETAIFGQNTQIQGFQLSFLGLFFLLCQQQKHKNLLKTPVFIVF